MKKATAILLVSLLALALLGCAGPADTQTPDTREVTPNQMKLTIGDVEWTVTLADNVSADALLQLLADGPVTVSMRDYANMEKVGSLGQSLPRSDEQITTEPGDVILYQGDALVIYYAPNSWNFTRLGKIDNVTADELKAVLGDGSVDVTLSLTDEEPKKENEQ